MTVQGYSLQDDPPPGEQPPVESVECIACGGIHFVNPSTGELAFRKDDG